MLQSITENMTSNITFILGILGRERRYLPNPLCFPIDWLFFVHTSAIKVPVEGSISILPQRFNPQAICIKSLLGVGVKTSHLSNHM